MTAKRMPIVALPLAACLFASGLGVAGPSGDDYEGEDPAVARHVRSTRITYPGDLDAVLAKGTKAWLEEQLELVHCSRKT